MTITANQPIVSHLYLALDGTPVAQELLQQIIEVTVDQDVHLPGMFTVRLTDPALALLEKGPFDLAKTIEIAGENANREKIVLLQGEITALEPDFGEGMVAELVVRGYDNLHRLYRKVKSKTYLNVKDSDLAREIAAAADLSTDIEPTTTVYAHIYQHNQSDLSFLMQRAWRIGYECYAAAGKLVFRKPSTASPTLTLTWGDDLVTFRPRMTVAEQVEQVIVRGWDVAKKSAIVGRANKGQLYPAIQENGGDLSKKFGAGSQVVLVDQPVVTQAEADLLATARLNEISGVFVEAEGTAFRRPELKAGQLIKIAALGKRFNGAYLLTSVTHVYTSAGFTSHFRISGLRTGLLTDQLQAHRRLDQQPGPASAIVTNTDDPQGWGRIKVKYPWMSDEEESDWLRVVSAGAGPTAGFCATPAIDDEVLVGFIHGDFNQPVAFGGLWNGADRLPETTAQAASGELPLVRTWTSRTGHQITMYDNAKNKIEIKSAAGHLLTLTDADQKLSLVSKGGLEITLDDAGKEITIKSNGKVTVQSSAAMEISADGDLNLTAGGNVQLEARGNLMLQATGQASVGSAAAVALHAPQISLG